MPLTQRLVADAGNVESDFEAEDAVAVAGPEADTGAYSDDSVHESTDDAAGGAARRTTEAAPADASYSVWRCHAGASSRKDRCSLIGHAPTVDVANARRQRRLEQERCLGLGQTAA